MSIYTNVTKQDLINLRNLAEQQKNQRALKIKNRSLKQTHDFKIAESLSPMTEKLDEVKETTQKLGDVIKESNTKIENNQEIVPVEIDSNNSEVDNTKLNIRALPNSSIGIELMVKTLGSLMSSSNSLKTKSPPSGATILGVPIYTLGGDKLRTRDNDFELTPENYKALSYTGYTGKSMKYDIDILMMNNIINDLGYTGVGDRASNIKTVFTKNLPKLVKEIQNKTFDEFDLDGQRIQNSKNYHPI